MSLVNKDFIWRISGSTGTHKKIIEKEYDTRFGVFWFLLTNWSELPSRFTIQRMRKPYLASPRKKADVFGADDPFVANLVNQPAERE